MQLHEPGRRREYPAREIHQGALALWLFLRAHPDPPTAEPALETHTRSGRTSRTGYGSDATIRGKHQLPLKLAPGQEQVNASLQQDRRDGEIPNLFDVKVRQPR